MPQQVLDKQTYTPTEAIKTVLLSDIVKSTDLNAKVGNKRFAEIMQGHERMVLELLPQFNGRLIDRSDGFLLLFERPIDAARYALACHAELTNFSKQVGEEIAERIGIDMGEVALTEKPATAIKPLDVVGKTLSRAARISSAGRGGQTLLSKTAFDAAREAAVGNETLPKNLSWLEHGDYLLQGIDGTVTICEVGLEGQAPLTAPPDTEKIKRVVETGAVDLGSWRPAAGKAPPGRDGWVLQRLVGKGGFGEIWLAKNRSMRTEHAFKFCFDAKRLRALKRELMLFKLMKEVLGDRPDIAILHDIRLDEPPYFLEMEYAPGGNLADWAERSGGIDRLPVETRLELVAQIASAASAAHSVGIIHKDIKPTNVLIKERRDGSVQCLLTDFGIGQLVALDAFDLAQITAAGMTQTMAKTDLASLTGTWLYMDPNLKGSKQPSIQSDIYSLGVLLYQAVIGDFTRPLFADGWEDLVDDTPLPEGFSELLREDIKACVTGVSAKRLTSAEELARRLRSIEERRDERQAEIERERREQRVRRVLKVGAVALPVLILLVAGGMFSWSQRVQAARSRARAVLARNVYDAPGASAELIKESRSVRKFYNEELGKLLSAEAFTERIMGVRSVFSPGATMQEEFWRSVDGGPLWLHGEWLELCRLYRDDAAPILAKLETKARGGSNREKYVAFCLMGQLAKPGTEYVELCANAVRTEKHPGVVSAAWWAARQLDREVDFATSESVYVDSISEMVFVQIPGTDEFRPGSPADDEYRWSNEDRPAKGVAIGDIWVSTTEVTWSQIEAFWPWLEAAPGASSAPLEKLRNIVKFCKDERGKMSESQRARSAFWRTSFQLGILYCAWLNEQSQEKGQSVQYDLLTEDEWEYACRGSSAQRFCYGDSPEYAPYFAVQGGNEKAATRNVATKMPNFYGLFDMHGNVWEICSSVYRDDYDEPVPALEGSMEGRMIVRRGGAIYSPAVRCRSAQRNTLGATQADGMTGLRIVLYKGPRS